MKGKQQLGIDLHVHSIISDGVYSPDQLIEESIGKLSVLAITDHNCINPNLSALRIKYPQIELPTGCEFSCNYTIVREQNNNSKVIQLHVGGIGFNPDDEAIQRVLKHNQSSIRGYMEKTLLKLRNNCNIDLCTFDELLSRNPLSQSIGRKHIAAELVRQGYCSSIEAAFDTYLGNSGGYKRPAYVSNAMNFASLSDVVKAITSAGGIASMCHLYDYISRNQMSSEEVDTLLSVFKTIGGRKSALETYYSAYSKEQQNHLRMLSQKHHLLESAASDFHGDGKIKKLGSYPYEVYEKMLKAMTS